MGDLTLRVDPDPGASVEALLREMTHRRFLGEHADEELAAAAARSWADRVLPHAQRLVVHVGDVERGHVWLSSRDDELTVLALSLDDRALAGDVRAALLERCTTEGARRLTAGVAPGDPVAEEFARGGGFEVSAVQMRLPLDGALPPEPALVLTPFDDADYAAFEADEIASYAAERMLSGESEETAWRISREEHADLLPEGLATPHHHFFTGRVDGVRVGEIWLSTARPMVFVYNLAVDEDQRRRGYGGALMRAAALWARERGAHALGLNVFGHNHGARALYERLGFHVVEQFVGRTP